MQITIDGLLAVAPKPATYADSSLQAVAVTPLWLSMATMPAATRSAAKAAHSRTRAWHWYANDGSYAGQFDWVPRHLRVGRWHYLVTLSLSAAPFLLLYSKPASDSTIMARSDTERFSSSHLLDVVEDDHVDGHEVVSLAPGSL